MLVLNTTNNTFKTVSTLNVSQKYLMKKLQNTYKLTYEAKKECFETKKIILKIRGQFPYSPNLGAFSL